MAHCKILFHQQSFYCRSSNILLKIYFCRLREGMPECFNQKEFCGEPHPQCVPPNQWFTWGHLSIMAHQKTKLSLLHIYNSSDHMIIYRCTGHCTSSYIMIPQFLYQCHHMKWRLMIHQKNHLKWQHAPKKLLCILTSSSS